jgi:hypothetical protein
VLKLDFTRSSCNIRDMRAAFPALQDLTIYASMAYTECLPTSLTALSMNEGPGAGGGFYFSNERTDDSLSICLGQLTQMQRLSLNVWSDDDNAGAFPVHHFTPLAGSLTYLSLVGFGPVDTSFLSALTRLEELTLDIFTLRRAPTVPQLPLRSPVRRLCLSLEEMASAAAFPPRPVSAGGALNLGGWPRLRELELAYVMPDEALVQHLAGLPLQKLRLCKLGALPVAVWRMLHSLPYAVEMYHTWIDRP